MCAAFSKIRFRFTDSISILHFPASGFALFFGGGKVVFEILNFFNYFFFFLGKYIGSWKKFEIVPAYKKPENSEFRYPNLYLYSKHFV